MESIDSMSSQGGSAPRGGFPHHDPAPAARGEASPTRAREEQPMTDGDSRDLRAFSWDGNELRYIDVRRLPEMLTFDRAATADDVIAALAARRVGGTAGAELFGAFGVALARRDCGFAARTHATIRTLRDAVRTARGGFVDDANTDARAIERVAAAEPAEALACAQACLRERNAVDRAIAQHARTLLPDDATILTHGNSGTFSTGGAGTALGAIVAGHRAGKRLRVVLGEGGPHLADARLAAFELQHAGVPVTLTADIALASVVRDARIAAIVVDAARIATNGDVVAPVGTYGLAIIAAHHGIPMYVTTARETIDGQARRAEMLDRAIAHVPGRERDLTFDVTPGHLITAIVTEYGVTPPPYHESIPALLSRPNFALIDASTGMRITETERRRTSI